VRLKRFCTETTSTSARPSRACSIETFETPIWRILPLGLKILESPHGFLVRHLRIRPVELVELDRVQSQAAERPLARLAQVVGIAIGIPLIRTGPHEPALGGDQEAFRVGMKGLGNQPPRSHPGRRIGGVDQVDAQVHSTAENGDRLIVVCRRAPDPFAGDPHRAEPRGGGPGARRSAACRWTRRSTRWSRCSPSVQANRAAPSANRPDREVCSTCRFSP